MSFGFITQSLLFTGVFSAIVLIIFWVEYRRTRARLYEREEQMKRRVYEISILREIGERIGYSLNVQKIVDIITGSLGDLLPYSTVSYMLPGEENRLVFNTTLSHPVGKEFIKEVRGRMLKSFSALFGRQYDAKDVEERITGAVTDPFDKRQVTSFFNVPIVINGKPAGILNVASTKAGLYKTSEEVEILYTIVSQASEAVSKLEQVLEIEKGKLNAMVASMADGVLMVDQSNRIIVINPKTLELLGIDTKKPPAVFDIFDAVSGKCDLRTKMEESVKRDQVVVENEIQMGDHFIQILISPVKDRKGNVLGTVVLFHDVTREKEVEKLREDFTSMMVHELRSPLTGIRSIASLLKSDKVKNQEQKYQEFVGLIESNSSSMLDLVNDLLDVAKLESGKFEVFKAPADITSAIRQRIESFKSLADEGKVALVEQIDQGVPAAVPFDENKIGQVLNNLISNAIKFTGEGGKITVSVFACKKGEDVAQLAASKKLPWAGLKKGIACPVDSLIVSVSDTGVGIPQADIAQLFNKFQQVSTAKKSDKKGTGLGLVIVKGVVEAHGGKVGIFSEEGKGTTFYFNIPLVDTAPQTAQPQQPAAVPDKPTAPQTAPAQAPQAPPAQPTAPKAPQTPVPAKPQPAPAQPKPAAPSAKPQPPAPKLTEPSAQPPQPKPDKPVEGKQDVQNTPG